MSCAIEATGHAQAASCALLITFTLGPHPAFPSWGCRAPSSPTLRRILPKSFVGAGPLARAAVEWSPTRIREPKVKLEPISSRKHWLGTTRP